MVEYFASHHGDFYSVHRKFIGLQRIGCPSLGLKQNCGHVYKQEHRYENTQRTSTAGIGQFHHVPVHWQWCVLQNQSQASADRWHQTLGRKRCLLLDDGRAIASHLCEIGTEDWFVLVRVSVKEGRALMVYEDGNDHEHARQEIPYTDFPLESITLYACWDQENWVMMLPSEY